MDHIEYGNESGRLYGLFDDDEEEPTTPATREYSRMQILHEQNAATRAALAAGLRVRFASGRGTPPVAT